jgi:hypothetical protein
MSNMRQLGTAQGSYAAEFQDRLYAFTWTRGHAESQWADLRDQAAMGDMSAAAAQAVDILRRRSGRTDISPINGWIPNVLYSHLVLQDFMASRLPEPTVACPEDAPLRDWQRNNGHLFDAGAFLPMQPAPASVHRRWPYSSSYMQTVGAFDPNQNRDIQRPGPTQSARLYQAESQCDGYYVPQTHRMGGTRLAEVDWPALKVHMFDRADRHHGPEPVYFAYPDARQPLLFFDGSVREYTTAETNRGWHPQFGTTSLTMQWRYEPAGPWQPAARAGTFVDGHYRWTRGGLRGIDVGGGEINTGQMD